jgi:hypothetical protein
LKLKQIKFYWILGLILLATFSLAIFFNMTGDTNGTSQRTSILDLNNEKSINPVWLTSIKEGNFSGTGNMVSAEKFGQIPVTKQFFHQFQFYCRYSGLEWDGN